MCVSCNKYGSPLTGLRVPTISMESTSSTNDSNATKSFSISPSNTNTAAGMGGPDLPTAILVAAAIIAGSFLILILLIVCIICFIAHKKLKSPEQVTRRNLTDVQATQFINSSGTLPMYSQVNKSLSHKESNDKARASTCTCSSATTTLHYAAHQLPEPHEILAYQDLDLFEKFRPLPPPPSITSGFSSPNTTLYDIPEATYDNDGNMVQGNMSNGLRGNNKLGGSGFLSKDGSNYYDQVEMVPRTGKRSQSMKRFGSYDDRERNRSMSSIHRTSSLKSASPGAMTPHYDHIYQEHLDPSMLHDSGTPDRTIRPLPYGPIYDVPKPLKNLEEPLEILPDHIIEIRELGIGRFGTVSLAATVGLSFKDIRLGENEDKNRSLLVAIKKLNSDGGDSLRESFEQEIKYMARLHHPNVVHLLGVCMTGEPFIMMEYMENGDLNEFLQKQMLVDDSVNLLQENEVSPLVLLYMTVQIASGMRYLSSKRVVHRDLATRNCLVGRDFVIKVSDFGMSRNLYDAFYYRVHGKLILPIRWMAYESFYGKFSVKSDVWAFGITMWEIYTLARREPYHEMSDEELIADAMKANNRKRPKRPPIVPDEIHEVMQRCWVHDPLMRGDFEEVYSRLFLAYTQMCQHCN